ncbi:carboxylesterase family protein [uncultured Prevotella sp.]|uniref:carboxylesterase/lipase family protein n=1 Tax=uncultured Prevotella sp. TaxID=159272 RepID=UPI002589ECA7|nr:carboxylesterase family protein [uncultured Prevotella sp.]
MKKRILISLAALFVALGVSSQTQVNVKVAEGILAGTDSSGVKIFKGVPFAAPPVGNLRWREPQPVACWQGVRDATKFGPNPMQERVFGDMNFGTKKMSEDCLYLNIWTPAKTMKEKLPVLIYFNGGGLIAGSGSEPRYAGQALARKGIVAVTANYREGIFGFFSLRELSKESGAGSGNYGLMDQAAAIRWVKANIEAFGGDPQRITIAGESAGSVSVSALMASPMSKGLFAQAIGSSGSILGLRPVPSLKEAEDEGRKIMARAGCRNLKELRAMPAEELMKKVHYSNMPTPCVDGRFFTEQPATTFDEGRQAHVPLLLGGNNQEMTMFVKTVDEAKAMARQAFGAAADSIFPLYGIQTDADLQGRPGIDLASDLFLDFSTWRWGYIHALTGQQPVYRYRYCHPRPAMAVKGKVAGLAGGVQDASDAQPAVPRAKGAVHSADIEYAMGTLPTNRVYDWQPEDYWVSDQFINYYANFIKTGNPNGLGLVEWPQTNGEAVEPILQLDVNSFVSRDAKREQRNKTILRLVCNGK